MTNPRTKAGWVRDSKNPTGPVLTCNPAQWVAFTAAISRGQFG